MPDASTSLVANVSMLFRSVAWAHRCRAASDAGFAYVESWWPRGLLLGEFTEEDLVGWVAAAGVRVALINADEGDMAGGVLGLALAPESKGAFTRSLEDAGRVATLLECPNVCVLAGKRTRLLGDDETTKRLVGAMRQACDVLGEQNLKVLIEPINAIDVPDYAITTTARALEILDLVQRPNAALLLDTYHAARAGEIVADSVRLAGQRLGHLQLADHPGRHEPFTGALDWNAVADALVTIGYQGAVALEYAPSDPLAPDFSYLADLERTLGLGKADASR